MCSILLNNSQAVLGAISWLDLTSLLGIIMILIYGIRIGRSRVTKEDMNSALGKKASKNMVISELKLRDERILRVEEMSNLQDTYIKERFEEQHAILDVIQSDIKKLIAKIK
jgi:hypothetical protein